VRALGSDTEQVLADLAGVDAAELERLRSAEAI
jgi:crotonobetainyl-CoA:carnitine CoA-transferase CaiB-like acyl-CoA transferase